MSGPFYTSRTPLMVCPVCARPLDAATSVRGVEFPTPETAKSVSMTVCIGCGAILKFGAELRLIRMTRQELEALPDKDFKDLSRVQQSIMYLIQKRDGR